MGFARRTTLRSVCPSSCSRRYECWRLGICAKAQEQELSKGANMPNTSPIDMGKDTANMKDGGDTMEHYADEMSSEAGSSGLESSDAKRAKTQAVALSQAAESARA